MVPGADNPTPARAGRSSRGRATPPAIPSRRPRPTIPLADAPNITSMPRRRATPAASRPASDSLRLQLVLARAGVASRRESEELMVDGRVTVDGVVVRELGTRVDPSRQRVAVDGRPIARPAPPRYLMLNKPIGFVTTVDDPDGRPTVMQLVPPIAGLFPVGRLDVASEGLILLTTDGEWAQRASHPKFGCLKEYIVDVTGEASLDVLATMRAPMAIGPDDRTTGARVDVLSATRSRTRLRIVLHEGRNRQIRRMCEAVGLAVTELVRVRVGGIGLGNLAPGEWRNLAPHEVETIARHVASGPSATVLRGLQVRARLAARGLSPDADHERSTTASRVRRRGEAPKGSG